MSALGDLSKSLGDAVRKLLRLPIVDEKAIRELVKDLQRALLQADVNVELVLQISRSVEKRAIEERLPPGISRREHVIKVLYEELTRFLGEEAPKTTIPPGKTYVVMLVGIQGTGKTTAAVKLARFYQKRGLRVGIICADNFRPGAYEQLAQLADKVSVPVYGDPKNPSPEKLVKEGFSHFEKEKENLIIVDTAGRHKNEAGLMDEMNRLAKLAKPDEIVLAVDGSIGQAAMAQARAFNEATNIGSILVTKLDGTAKGGGALSAVAATGAKIKFISVGEGTDDLEQFVPSNYVGRILGIGDVASLVEKVREAEIKIPEKKARAMLEGRFNLKDMYDQLEAVRKMGPLKKVLGMLPGAANLPDDAMENAEEKMDAWRVMIQSMTKDEVEEPKIIDSSRARRIARGSGRTEKEVKELVNQYSMMKKMMKSMKRRQGAMMRRLPFQL
ncbi:MAG: signal recognition particle protein Srp54 [Candidatus Bathyarchaeia archaeon]